MIVNTSTDIVVTDTMDEEIEVFSNLTGERVTVGYNN